MTYSLASRPAGQPTRARVAICSQRPPAPDPLPLSYITKLGPSELQQHRRSENPMSSSDPYGIAPSEDGISGAILMLGQLTTDYEVCVPCPSAHLASFEMNTTSSGNSYKNKTLFAALENPHALTATSGHLPRRQTNELHIHSSCATAGTGQLRTPE